MGEINIPFFSRCIKKGEDYNYPEKLKFEYFIDEKTGLLRQKKNEIVELYLSKVYQEGSLFEGSLSNESGNVYFKPFTSFIKEHTKSTSSLLEIGCGNGNLLKELEKDFDYVQGIEPSKKSSEAKELNIVEGFFPFDLEIQKFQNIIHFGVLEHMSDPCLFLQQHKIYLDTSGRIIFAVPNCTASLNEGDISMFFHEHYSYFDENSLRNLLAISGFRLLKLQTFMGMFFAVAEIMEDTLSFKFHFNNIEYLISEKLYDTERILKQFRPIEIAVYPALRAINYLAVFNLMDVRLIDDSTELFGLYIPGFQNSIENFDSLQKAPPSLILIATKTFKSEVLLKIKNSINLKLCKVAYL